jgi:hypothetical protein
MNCMSYQPSHLEYKDWGEPPSGVFIMSYTPQNVISSSMSVRVYLPKGNRTQRTEYDRMVHEVLRNVASCGF